MSKLKDFEKKLAEYTKMDVGRLDVHAEALRLAREIFGDSEGEVECYTCDKKPEGPMYCIDCYSKLEGDIERLEEERAYYKKSMQDWMATSRERKHEIDSLKKQLAQAQEKAVEFRKE